MIDNLSKFRTRLEKIGIDVTFAANFPWIYFDTINGKEVTGTFHADHGWTAFFMQLDGSYKFSDRREVFKKVREYIKMKPELNEAFTYWYERFFCQSPSLSSLKYDDEKMWEAWKAGYFHAKKEIDNA